MPFRAPNFCTPVAEETAWMACRRVATRTLDLSRRILPWSRRLFGRWAAARPGAQARDACAAAGGTPAVRGAAG
jgi:hypothetical protein